MKLQGRSSLKIGVIDSGWSASYTIPQVRAGVCLLGSHFSQRSELSCDTADRCGHGTQTVLTIAAICPDALIVPVRIFDRKLQTTPRSLLAAIDWCTEQELDIINLSASTPLEEVKGSLYRACERLRIAGKMLVASSANDGGISYPAAFDNVLGVGLAKRPLSDEVLLPAVHDTNSDVLVSRGPISNRAWNGESRIQVGSTSRAAAVVSACVARMIHSGVGNTSNSIGWWQENLLRLFGRGID